MRRVSVGAAAAAAFLFALAGAALAGDPHATGGGEFAYGVNQKLSFEVYDYGLPESDRRTASTGTSRAACRGYRRHGAPPRGR